MPRFVLAFLLALAALAPAASGQASFSPSSIPESFPTIGTLSSLGGETVLSADLTGGFAHAVSSDGATAEILLVPGTPAGSTETLTVVLLRQVLTFPITITSTAPQFSVQIQTTTVDGMAVVGNGDTVASAISPVTVQVQVNPPSQTADVVIRNALTGQAEPLALDASGQGSATFALDPGLNAFVATASDPACPTCDPFISFWTVDFQGGGGGGFDLANAASVRAPFEPVHNAARNVTIDGWSAPCAACTGCPPETELAHLRQRGGGGAGDTWIRNPFTTPDDDDGKNVNLENCTSYWHLGLISLPGRGIDLRVRASYSSNLTLGPAGYVMGTAGWSHNYIQRMLPGAAGTLRRFDGGESRIDTFTDRGDGLFTAPGHAAALRVNADGSIELRMRGGVIYRYKALTDNVAPGALERVSDPHDNAIELFYEGSSSGFGRLVRIVDTYGADALTFAYRPDGLLDRIADLAGREVVLGYDGSNRLASVRSPVGSAFPSGRVYTFGYVADSILLGRVIYPNENAAGLDEPRVQWTYDPLGFVTSQTLGGTNLSGAAAGGTITYVRGTRSGGTRFMRVTDRNGNVTEYDFAASGQTVKKTELTNGKRSGGPFVTTYGYNASGLSTSVVYPEGNALVHTYLASPDPYQIQDVVETRRLAGPRGGDQSEIAVRRSYEAVFGKVVRTEDPRLVDPGFAPPLGAKANLVTTIVYEYQELTSLPPRESGWGIDPADLDLGKPDLNGNGTAISSCSTVQSITLPTTTLPGGGTQVRRVLMTHNVFGQKTSMTDPGGVVTTYTYTPEADVVGDGSFVVPGGSSVTGGFLASVTRDASAGSVYAFQEPITTSVAFNRIGDVQRATDGRGITTVFATNEIHLTTQVIAGADTAGQAGARNESEPVPALSIVSKLTYDANSNVVRSEVDNRDNGLSHNGAFIATRTTYDILDQPIRVARDVTETETVEATIGYDANQNSVRYDDNQVPHTHIRRSFDSRDLLVESIRGLGAEAATSRFDIDTNGNVVKVTGPVDRAPEAGAAGDGALDIVALLTRDGFDRVTRTTDGLGNRTDVTYDPASNVVSSVTFGHPANQATAAAIQLRASEFVHDEASRLVKTRMALFVDSATQGSLLRAASLDTDNPSDATFVELVCRYDVNSLKTQLSVANRALGGVETSTFEHDGHYRVRRQTDAVGNVVELLYNNNHQVVRTTETDVQPEGEIGDEVFVSSVVRDAIGRVITATDPKGAESSFTWGTLFMRRALDRLRNKTTVRRDGLGRTLNTQRFLTITGEGGGGADTSNPANPDGVIKTNTFYNDAGNRIRLEDDNSNATRYAHDSRGNVTRVRYADDSLVKTTYDLGDAPVSVTDHAGNVFANTFDILGRLVQTDITRAAGFVGTTQIRRGYDGLSRMTSCTDNGGDGDLARTSQLDCRWDSLSNKLEEVHNGRVVSRTYKSAGDPVSLTYPDTTRLDYRTDRLDRLTAIEEGSATTARWRYIGGRTHRREWGNGTTTEYTWDSDRRLVGLDHKRGGASFLSYSLGYNDEDYALHQRRNHDGGLGEQVVLDSAYRVRSYRDGVQDPQNGPGAGTLIEESFVLDGVGNWNSQTTNKDQAGAQTVTNAINEMNEYTSFGSDAQPHNNNGDRLSDDQFSYDWDALGRLRRVRDQTTGEILSIYGYHGDGRRTYSRETQVDGSTRQTEFAWDGMRMVEELRPSGGGVVRAKTIWGRGWELVKYQKNNPFFFHRDGKGWIAALTNSGGNIKESYLYSAYGKPRFFDNTGAEVAEQAFDSPWLWHGYYRDRRVGRHYYTVHRYMDPDTGRWLSRDPLGYLDGMNPYGAFAESPMALFDPLGLFSWRRFFKGVGKAIYRMAEGAVQPLVSIANAHINTVEHGAREGMRRNVRAVVRSAKQTAQGLGHLGHRIITDPGSFVPENEEEWGETLTNVAGIVLTGPRIMPGRLRLSRPLRGGGRPVCSATKGGGLLGSLEDAAVFERSAFSGRYVDPEVLGEVEGMLETLFSNAGLKFNGIKMGGRQAASKFVPEFADGRFVGGHIKLVGALDRQPLIRIVDEVSHAIDAVQPNFLDRLKRLRALGAAGGADRARIFQHFQLFRRAARRLEKGDPIMSALLDASDGPLLQQLAREMLK